MTFKKYFTLAVLFFILLGCEVPLTKKNIRSPHMPVFSQITPKAESKSNPYWIRFTAINDEPSITLSDSYVFVPDKPTAIGTIGTHYRWGSDYYGYVMTDGLGIQKDIKFWAQSKLAVGAFVGINNSWGLQTLYAHKVGEMYNGDITLYTSLQRRGGYQFITCEPEEYANCRDEAPSSVNRMRSSHNAFDFLLGVEMGRFKIGDVGNTTVNFKVELGYNKILDSKIDFEDYTSNFQQNSDNLTFSIHSGLTLW